MRLPPPAWSDRQGAAPLSPFRRFLKEAHRRGLWQVFGIFVGGGWGVLQVIDLFIERGFVPEWVFGGALLALLAGLPVVLTTAYVQGGRGVRPFATAGDEEESGGPTDGVRGGSAEEGAAADGPPSEPGAAGAPSEEESAVETIFTWQNAIGGGVLAFALLGVITAGYLVMRVAGIGAPGTLVAQGVFEVGGQVVLADFESSDGGGVSGDLVTEALRIDLAQSPTLQLMPNSLVNAALERMQRSAADGLPEDIAVELAAREGAEGVISGEVGRLGSSVVITARLLGAGTGDELASFRVTAEREDEVIRAVDQLSRRMREKVGESLRSVAQSEPLEAVSTSSLPALERYTTAARNHTRGLITAPVAVRLYQEAVEIDSTFAAAHRAIAVTVNNFGGDREVAARAIRAAYRHRHRLPERERLFTEASYHMQTGEEGEAAPAFESLLAIDPSIVGAAGNLSHIYSWKGRYDDVLRVAEGFDIEESQPFTWNVMVSLVALRRFDEASTVLDNFEAESPDFAYNNGARALFLAMSGRPDSASAFLSAAPPSSDAAARSWEIYVEGVIRTRLGQLDAAAEVLDGAERVARSATGPTDQLFYGLSTPWTVAIIEGDTAAAAAEIEKLHREVGWNELSEYNRHYAFHALAWARFGFMERAAEMLAAFEPLAPNSDSGARDTARFAAALVAIRRGDPNAAVLLEAAADEAFCNRCSNFTLGHGYELLGDTAAAIAAYERYLATPFFDGTTFILQNFEPWVHERLGGLYDARGDNAKAVEHYRAFATAWANADPDLQPRVRAARERADALSGG